MRLTTDGFQEADIEPASLMAYEDHVRAARKLGSDPWMTIEAHRDLITRACHADPISAVSLREGTVLKGFAIGEIRRDRIWGDSGWVKLGLWSISSDAIDYLDLLYGEVGKYFVESGLLHHVVQIHDQLEILLGWNSLGFARQQTHALKRLTDHDHRILESEGVRCRPAMPADEDDLAAMSRIIGFRGRHTGSRRSHRST